MYNTYNQKQLPILYEYIDNTIIHILHAIAINLVCADENLKNDNIYFWYLTFNLSNQICKYYHKDFYRKR